VSLVVLALAALAWARFDPASEAIQFREHATWIPLSVPIHYTMGLDGISLALVALTAFLMPLAIRASWHQSNGFIIALLFLETGMMGAFCALDLFLFYVFWEAMLIPMYLLIGIWGGPRRIYASVKFILYTIVGSVLMLAAILYCGMQERSLRRDGPGQPAVRTAGPSRIRGPASCSSSRSRSPSPSRSRCSHSTRGCPTPTSRPPRPAR
jgi:NADH-quinone oxidoreductase subunit M